MEPRKLRPSCNEIEIQVIPLPEEGRPKDFKGVVGDFEITMTADPKNSTWETPFRWTSPSPALATLTPS